MVARKVLRLWMPEAEGERPDTVGRHPQHKTGLAHVGNFEPAGGRHSGLAGGIGQYLAHVCPCLEIASPPLGTHWGRKMFGYNGIERNAEERKSYIIPRVSICKSVLLRPVKSGSDRLRI